MYKHLGKTGSELKTDLPKGSVLAAIVALWAKGSSQQTVHKPAPHGNTAENQPAADGPSYQAYDLGSHTTSQFLSKLSKREGQHPLPHSPAYQP
jgi:hypothetical protein